MRKEPEDFAKRLQWLREKRGISRSTLSELCGLSRNMIARYERGEAEPNLSALVAIADFFDVTTDFLIHKKN